MHGSLLRHLVAAVEEQEGVAEERGVPSHETVGVVSLITPPSMGVQISTRPQAQDDSA